MIRSPQQHTQLTGDELIFSLRSIRARALIALGVIFSVVLSIAIYRAYERRATDLDDAMERLATHAQLITEKQRDVIRSAQQFLEVMVNTGGASRLIHEPGCGEFLQRYQVRTPQVATAVIATPAGLAVCHAVPTPAPVHVADRDYFQRAIQTSEPVIGKALVSRSAAKWSLPVAQSFTDNAGKVEGVAAVLLDLGWINQEFAKAGYPLDARLGLIDSDGTVLARYPDPDARIAKNLKNSPFFRTLVAQRGIGTAEATGFDGALRVYAFAHFAETPAGPIYLWVGMTKSSITAKAERQFYSAIYTTAVVMVAAMLAVWFGVERLIIRPIRAIGDTARRLSKGDYRARSGVPHTTNEIGRLASAFDEMALALLSNSEILRLNRSLEVLSGCNKILIHATNEDQLLKDICQNIVDVGGYRMAWVGYPMDDKDKSVRPVAHHGFDDGYLDTVQVTWADTERGQGPTGKAIRTRQAQVNRNFSTNVAMTPWQASAASKGYRSSSAFPLISGGQVLGALTIYSAIENPFSPEEIRLLEELAADLAFGITSLRTGDANAHSRKRLELSLEATIQSMAATLELRDAYTAGHQRRVSELATAIARELGLPEDEIRGIHLAAVVHDLGKIQVPAELLVKPTRLDDVEFKLIQRHPQAGYDILKGIDFPWPIAELVRQHHERIDGSGYPRGLTGDELLIGAKILAIADVVEAMSSHRPYRAALGIETALEEIERNKGKFYDPAAADACIRLFREQRFAFGTAK